MDKKIAIVYLSESNTEMSEDELNELAASAARKNEEIGITGYLSHQRNRFIQYIEGEESKIMGLMASIEKDERHRVIHKIQKDHWGERIFPNWSMRLIKQDELKQFQLELQIEQNLVFIKNDFAHKDRCETFLWKHVKLIAKIRALYGNKKRHSM